MTPGPGGPRRSHPLRMWWALPGLAVASTAIAMAVVVGPTLGEHVSIPRQLVLPASATSAAPKQAPTHAVRPRHHPSPKPTATPAPPSASVAQTHVVTPRRPVVTASGDDSHEHESGSEHSGVETPGTDR